MFDQNTTSGWVSKSASQLLGRTLSVLREGTCAGGCSISDCSACEAAIMWHQLAVRIVKMMAPNTPAHPPDVSILYMYIFLHIHELHNTSIYIANKKLNIRGMAINVIKNIFITLIISFIKDRHYSVNSQIL